MKRLISKSRFARFARVQLAILILILFLPSVAQAQKSNGLKTDNVVDTVLVSIGCEGTNCAGLTIDATAGGVVLTASKYSPTITDQHAGFSKAERAVCYNVGAKIWVTDLSTITLSSGKGSAINDGERFTIYGSTNISNFKAIRDAAVSSLLYCTYYRQP